MSEAIISRRGYNSSGKPELRTETITGSTVWVVPNSIRGNISVMVYGAGGGGRDRGRGGGGGWMNNGEFKIAGGTSINITIGKGGATSMTGGTTSFGTYLSANGGGYGDGGSGGGGGGIGYQFGGGGACAWFATTNAGNGGIYGGGGGGRGEGGGLSGDVCKGGTGGQYGGGGGGGASINRSNYRRQNGASGGNGGTYGGGGGGGTAWRGESDGSFEWYSSGSYGRGGQYGGHGSTGSAITTTNGNNGTNTIGNTSVDSNLRGSGNGGKAELVYIPDTSYERNLRCVAPGGGGFGGCGGTASNIAIYDDVDTDNSLPFNSTTFLACGGGGAGGGGYGGNGGCAQGFLGLRRWMAAGGAGGGGYGGNGGNSSITASNGQQGGGGGGGYFADGGSAPGSGGGGGGGYYGRGGNGFGDDSGGGGGYGQGADGNHNAGYGGGGCGNNKGGGDGICIIQYYA